MGRMPATAAFSYGQRGKRADLSELLHKTGWMLKWGGVFRQEFLEQAQDICTVTERKAVVTTFAEDASAAEYTDYLPETIEGLRR